MSNNKVPKVINLNITIANEIQTRDLNDLQKKVTVESIGEKENVYCMIAILAKRADQISRDIKEELNDSLKYFNIHNDNLEEVQENKERIEVSKSYEKLPHPTLLAIQEFSEDKIYFKLNDSMSLYK